MHPATRFVREIQLLGRHLTAVEQFRYLGAVTRNAPAIMRTRTLAPADGALQHDVVVRVGDRRIIVPVGAINRLLEGEDPTPAFSGIREMIAGNVYLRAFRPGIPMTHVVDLGSNRGLFSILAVRAYDARLAVGVEPLAAFAPAFDLLRARNEIDPRTAPREVAFIASSAGPDALTMAALMERHSIRTIDFLKCDIEGAEFDVVLNNNSFLGAVSNIAMELHPSAGDVRLISDALLERGFEVRVTDQFGLVAGGGEPHYLYASRTGDLAL